MEENWGQCSWQEAVQRCETASQRQHWHPLPWTSEFVLDKAIEENNIAASRKKKVITEERVEISASYPASVVPAQSAGLESHIQGSRRRRTWKRRTSGGRSNTFPAWCSRTTRLKHPLLDQGLWVDCPFPSGPCTLFSTI